MDFGSFEPVMTLYNFVYLKCTAGIIPINSPLLMTKAIKLKYGT